MNFQELADSFDAPTCIISVERTADGGYGDIRLVTGNKSYIEPIEHPVYSFGFEMPPNNELKFVPNSLYNKYLPKDIGFEDICYRSAVKKIPLHTYVHMNHLDIWFDIFIMPLSYEDGDICYCAYTAQPNAPADIGLSSSHSGRNTEDVLKTCIKLHDTNDFKKTMDDVINDIRLLCAAEVCTIMLVDTNSLSCNVLATSVAKDSKLKRVTQFSNFYDIAVSWLDTIGESDCLIAKSKRDMQYISKVNNPWYLTLEEAGVESVVMFPLRYNDELLGFIWATNFDTNNTMCIKETLELTTFFISSQIASYRMVEKLKHISYTDRLTKLPNRFSFSELVKDLIKRKERFAVVSIDINGFKSINDTMGFDNGNLVLIEIANRWKDIADSGITSTNDYIARLGGDEFVLIIRGYSSDEDIMRTIKQYEAVLGNRLTVDGCDFYITAGFGYAEYPVDAQNNDSLLSYANAAMNEVKRFNSSDHILRFSPEFLKEERTLEIERKLRTALENDTIFFHLQPQYDLSHKLRGFEALARMKDEDGNFISPGEFIPVAEKVGIVDKIDGAVFRKSAVFLGKMLRKTSADITLSVNISVRHLMKNGFIDEVRDVLNISGIPANHLEIEITESIMIDSAEKALKCIDELKNMGIMIAIDDFGTGYSSLSYLNSFPANLLKIDKSFIDKMNTSDSSKQYVAAIISIGHIMGLEVISEGVEENEQLETLRTIGCDYIQGYIWGKPLPENEAAELIMKENK